MIKIIFKNIINLNDDIKKKVRIWRNQPEIRNNMVTRHIISEKEHNKWLKSLTKRDDWIVWVVFYQNKPIGICSLSNINKVGNTTDWGVYIGEDKFKGKGLSKYILFKLIDKTFNEMNMNKMYTSVLSSNTQAIKIYERFGFLQCKNEQKTEEDRKSIEFINIELDKNRWFQIREKIKL